MFFAGLFVQVHQGNVTVSGVKYGPTPGKGPNGQALFLTVKIEKRVVGNLVDKLPEGKKKTGGYMPSLNGLVASDEMCSEAQGGVVFGKRCVRMRAQNHDEWRGRPLALGNSLVIEIKTRRIGRYDGFVGMRQHGRHQGDEPGVPAWIKVGVGVDLQQEVFTIVEGKGDISGPRDTSAVDGVDLGVANVAAVGKGFEPGAMIIKGLINDGDMHSIRMIGLFKKTVDGKTQKGVAKSSKADKNFHDDLSTLENQ